LDALYLESYQSNAKALKTSSVCEVSFDSLQELGKDMPQLQIQLPSRLSKELSGDKSLMLLLGKKQPMKNSLLFYCHFLNVLAITGFLLLNFTSPCLEET
jgi:CRP/FNR family transcriptional regulator